MRRWLRAETSTAAAMPVGTDASTLSATFTCSNSRSTVSSGSTARRPGHFSLIQTLGNGVVVTSYTKQ